MLQQFSGCERPIATVLQVNRPQASVHGKRILAHKHSGFRQNISNRPSRAPTIHAHHIADMEDRRAVAGRQLFDDLLDSST